MPVIIRSTKEGFRRCGIAHTKAAVTYPDDRFTIEALYRLKAEPRLLVEVTEGEEPGSDKTDEADLLSLQEAARKAIADGNVIGSGAPDTKAMAEILGYPVSAAQRDEAWTALQNENQE